MSLISESRTLLQAVASPQDVGQMGHSLENHHFKLRHWTRGAPYRLDRSRPKQETIELVAQGPDNSLQRSTPALDSSVESSIGLGFLFCTFITVALGVLTYLWRHALDCQG